MPVDSLRKRQAFEARRRAIDVLHVGVVWRGVGPVGWAPRAVRAAAHAGRDERGRGAKCAGGGADARDHGARREAEEGGVSGVSAVSM